jgi:choline dehydrogenase-like flavoprotein
MALERLFPADFSPRQHHDEATDCNLPERWAVGYDELTPYYAAAERLYRVRGTIDPLRHEKDFSHLEPPPLSPVNQELWDHLAGKGLHPYRLPMACEFVPGCEGCQGYLCANNCKNNSTNICLEPAVNQYGAELLDECNVTKLEANGHEVTAVRGDYRGEKLVLRGRVIVLAAGALATPDLLLRSTSRHWPNGLANESGWVGRNLMRHHIDLYAVFPTHREKLSGNVKEIAFNDFYINGRQKLGSVQSFGYLPETDVIAADIEQDIRNGALPWAIFPFKLVRPVLKAQLARTRSKVIVLATILEDLPYSENMILPRLSDREPLSLKYRIRDYDRLRIELFRKEVRRVLKPYRVMLIKQAEKNKMLAHVAGTCRFGVDPTDSVVDANNRAHGLSNLYVADASFFPSSGGTNPALTIAANALRVADVLLAEGKC